MDLQQRKSRIELLIEIAVHVLTWSYIFLSPLFFKRRGDTINWEHYFHGFLMPVTICIAFYLNLLLSGKTFSNKIN